MGSSAWQQAYMAKVEQADCSVLSLKKIHQQFIGDLSQAFEHVPVNQLVHARAELVDVILTKLWQQFGLAQIRDLALIATGGYGRAELHPHSDIDILVLSQGAIAESVKPLLEQFITALWDLSLDVGHAVHTLEQVQDKQQQDLDFSTSIMESRLIAGSDVLFDALQELVWERPYWTSDKFFLAKTQEQALRHHRFNGIAYNLEPNLKANPGALRDIQTIGWVAKKHFKANTMAELVSHQFMTSEEYQELMECRESLWTMRFALHLVAGRSENRLLFDHQPGVAQMLGFGDDGTTSVERMMKRIFRIFHRIGELNQLLLDHFEHAILHKPLGEAQPLDSNFELVGEQIRARNPEVFFRRENLMQLFYYFAEDARIQRIHASTLRMVRQVRRRLMGDLQDYQACRQLFMRMLRHEHGFRAIAQMHSCGILGAYLPQWRNIVGQMQFDLFHAYTVDEHTYRLLMNIYQYFVAENSEFPQCVTIAKNMEKPELLYLAGIFHDIAKGRGGDHSDLGALDVQEFGKLHGLSNYDIQLVSWLVKNHLLMSFTAQRKDISDPDVINEFARKVKDETRLNYLYCLTVADIRATNENLWNGWKHSLFRELYNATQRALRRGLENPMDLRSQIRANKTSAKEKLQAEGFSGDAIDALWARFRIDYFLRNSVSQIVWQSSGLLTAGAHDIFVQISEKPIRGGTQVFIHAPDRENLFARVVTSLSSKKVNIHAAQIMTSKDGYALDFFVILEQDGSPIESGARATQISKSLMQVIAEPHRKLRTDKRISRKFRAFKVEPLVNFSPFGQGHRTLVEIQALDIPMLLSRIGEAFEEQNVNIHSARITTVGERAEDFFIISNADKKALSDQQQEQLRAALIQVLGPQHD